MSSNSNNNKSTTQQGIPARPLPINQQPLSPQQRHLPQPQQEMTLQRPPSLLAAGLPSKSASSPSRLAPPRPRRLWAVNDTSCRPIPRFYPKLDPKCTVFVSDASPSVVAVRISECLRKRSISAEYDEESVSSSQFVSWWWRFYLFCSLSIINTTSVCCFILFLLYLR